MSLEIKNNVEPVRTITRKETSEDGMEVTVLQCGSKELKIKFNPTTHQFTDFIRNQDNRYLARPNGDTTALYTEAKKVMQEITNQKQIPISLIHSTQNKNIALWAHTIGKDLFDWKQINGNSLQDIESGIGFDKKDDTKLKDQVKFEITFYPHQ